MVSKVCQIDHEQTSSKNESLLRKCSICKTIKFIQVLLKVKIRNTELNICVMTVKKDKMIPTRYIKRHFKNTNFDLVS
jgi:hypothetical protein